jgi:2,4-dienoyl-CoA reductase-like NADH-dependent reductase (Old Yellow Enzyme family)
MMSSSLTGKKRGIKHDVLATYRHLIDNDVTKVFVNGEVTPEEADKLIGSGVVDAAVFGKMWISNPDYQKRIEQGVEPNAKLDFAGFYNAPKEDLGKGYTDYPTAT